MKAGANLAGAVLVLLWLASCFSGPTEKEKQFDAENGHVIAPMLNVMRGENGDEIQLNYLEKYYADAIVCFSAEYSSTSIEKQKLKKFGVDGKLQQIPGGRGIPENKVGIMIISGRKQYNFVVGSAGSGVSVLGSNRRTAGSNYRTVCARTAKAVLKKMKHTNVLLESD